MGDPVSQRAETLLGKAKLDEFSEKCGMDQVRRDGADVESLEARRDRENPRRLWFIYGAFWAASAKCPTSGHPRTRALIWKGVVV